MANTQTIEDGIATALATITSLRVTSQEPDQVNLPAAWPELTGQQNNLCFDGTDVIETYDVTVVVQKGTKRTANKQLNEYVSTTGAKSVRAALKAAPTLGGAALGILSIELVAKGGLEINSQPFLGAVWRVGVLTA